MVQYYCRFLNAAQLTTEVSLWGNNLLSAPSPTTAVAILALIRSKTRAFPLSTVIVEQYRPPFGKFVVGQ